MKMREEIDALRTMGFDPVEVLILPRVARIWSLRSRSSHFWARWRRYTAADWSHGSTAG